MEDLKRGQLYYIKKSDFLGSSEGEKNEKPVLILAADKEIMEQSGTITVANITRRPRYDRYTHVEIQSLGYKAMAILEQEVTIATDRLGQYIGELSEEELLQIDKIVCKMRGIDLDGIETEYKEKLLKKDEEIEALKMKLQKRKGILGIF